LLPPDVIQAVNNYNDFPAFGREIEADLLKPLSHIFGEKDSVGLGGDV
jgi:hypothetical protein